MEEVLPFSERGRTGGRASLVALSRVSSSFRPRLRRFTVESPVQSVQNVECYGEDGRKSLAELYRSYMRLSEEYGWIMEGLYTQMREVEGRSVQIPVLSFRTPAPGPALWVLSGIHGEEPAGPNAIAENIEAFADLGKSGIPVIVIPLCNPKGYSLDWRFPNTADRTYKSAENPGGGVSVGDTESTSPDAKGLTDGVLRLCGTHPPCLVLDHHEDALEGGAYIYGMGHPPSSAAMIASEVLTCLGRPSMAIVSHGVTRFGEKIVEGQVFQPEGFRDGSLDELLWSESIVREGVRMKGPGARVVLTIETPAFQVPLGQRIAAHAAVFRELPRLWEMAHGSLPLPRTEYEDLFRGMH